LQPGDQVHAAIEAVGALSFGIGGSQQL